jgi:hypothetical protein
MVSCSKCKKELKNLLALNSHKRSCWYSYNNTVNHTNGRGKYHSTKTAEIHTFYESQPRKCKQCGISLPYKSRKNTFCSKNCSARYNNTHKKHGTRRSKLEIWIENKLKEKYPELTILFNSKEAIYSELDIYLPKLGLAFELNGIFHYESIYGDKILNQIQKNDNNKFYQCIANKIDLCIIDTTQQKYFKEQSSYTYLNIIIDIINSRLQTFGHQ